MESPNPNQGKYITRLIIFPFKLLIFTIWMYEWFGINIQGETSMNADSIVLEEEIDPNYVPSEEEGKFLKLHS